MPHDLDPNQNLAWQPIFAALAALQSQGIEITFTSIVTYANISQSQLDESPELVDFITQCQQIASHNTYVLAKLQAAEAATAALHDVVQNLTAQNQTLLEQQQQDIWQQGYETALNQSRLWYENQQPDQNHLSSDTTYDTVSLASSDTVNPATDPIVHDELPDQDLISPEELRNLIQSRIQRQTDDADHSPLPAGSIMANTTKFVGGNRPKDTLSQNIVRNVPPHVRKACLVLGVRPEGLTRDDVQQAWKSVMANPGTHPDLGGDTEIAVFLNTARDVLHKWLEAQEPKLGKQFSRKAAPGS